MEKSYVLGGKHRILIKVFMLNILHLYKKGGIYFKCKCKEKEAKDNLISGKIRKTLKTCYRNFYVGFRF